ncbi:uncharacterized protein BT62DRAFT_926344 [Guyanagaster necrorhizus]|uniref:F-box domain-containing protein n=1 Tax=Guyanagaster necrorhizus TaxID=856835 RepID=A0A9P7W3Z3_9AGAR|nr:uncharacterized protein BT62DRAFT_926344 [Guyanagaster necrorhizus MCA 3950]KAG7452124.1 hypothetical protein BT62DRAFT_926344 [Guyanagaster necrorhizus MCA 3950]
MSLFTTLPSELYSDILSHVPKPSLQKTVLSLSRAIPYSPVPLHDIFRCIRLSHPDQVFQLYRRLRTTTANDANSACINIDPAASWVRSFLLETWAADANVVINLVGLLTEIRKLTLWVGPMNFTPENLEELITKLKRDMKQLRVLELRFRPYVQKATYLPFLKGSYFDSTLLALAYWPHTILRSLSIVQDPLDLTQLQVAPGKSFAQPIVFFRLDHTFSSLLLCPHIGALRFCLPSRALIRAFTNSSPRTYSHIRILDLSTTSTYDADIDTIITRFSKLEHLVLDGCSSLHDALGGPTLEGTGLREEWYALGKRCALGGARRAKEREKLVKQWLETSREHEHEQEAVAESSTKKPRKGRKGLATATISLRSASLPPSQVAGPPKLSPSINLPQRVRIVPPGPTLKSLSIALPNTPINLHADILSAFERGWKDGLAQLTTARRTILQAWVRRNTGTNSDKITTKVVKFDDDEDEWNRLNGLDDVEVDDLEDEDRFVEECGVPGLCLLGPGSADDSHQTECGHQMSILAELARLS